MSKPWGCHSKSRKAGYWGRDLILNADDGYPPEYGWIWIEDTGTIECQYRKATPDDPRCKGCTSP